MICWSSNGRSRATHEAAPDQQVFAAAAFGDPACAGDQDLVSIADGGERVCDHSTGSWSTCLPTPPG